MLTGNDGMDDVTILVNFNPDKLTGLNISFNNVQYVPSPILLRFLHDIQHRCLLSFCHQNGSLYFVRARVGSFGGQVILPLAQTIELEVINLEGVGHSPEDAMLSRDGILFQAAVHGCVHSILENMSSASRCEKELSDIFDVLYIELKRHFNDDGTKIDNFQFLARYLSLVRDQGKTRSCSYVQAIACTEMIYRICSEEVGDLRDRFYFDIQDCFDQLYKKFPDLPNAKEKLHETMGSGTRLPYILAYLRKIGLLTNTACTNPQERNLDAIFIDTPERKKLDWYEKVEEAEVIQYLRRYPLIAVMHSYKSFKLCEEVEYGGPTLEETVIQSRLPRSSHTVLLVGSFSMRTENGERQYVIVQNSHGRTYAFNGYVVIPFDIPDLFVEFWVPILGPKMDCLKKHKRHPQMAGFKRKELESAV